MTDSPLRIISRQGSAPSAARADLPLRMRRLRTSENMRALVRENSLSPADLILPLFVEENISERQPITSMPGVFRETEKSIAAVVKEAESSGVKSVMLFGVSHNKDDHGTDSMKPDGLLARMIRSVKDAAPDMIVMADACFCEYTDHGHCGPLDAHGHVMNDATLENLAIQAVIAAEAGADIIAPSGMMDGMVTTIRSALDESGFENTAILSYAAKYASAFYGPFRDAAGCSLKTGDRKTHQMDPANSDEAMREVAIDLDEGADMVMVKPGLPYLDIIHRVKSEFRVPTFAYNVSGEYAMLKFAAQAGALDYDKSLLEMLMAFKRAGADGILTYAAIDAARLIKNQA
ncbi:MAG: delta-aminolevulinic acid dehydratase [Micavibrio sp.]|nr:delta-aminolevulinic acid dehydratase [Micavibrio sp.]